ncbi:hypothetical protein, partial [uncultured Parabacteroides sp.]|uniref:hypothetical protein n=1 Tax=uncultured Parabacteroides sp. TaxID=512312 RepID=UPI00258950A4
IKIKERKKNLKALPITHSVTNKFKARSHPDGFDEKSKKSRQSKLILSGLIIQFLEFVFSVIIKET